MKTMTLGQRSKVGMSHKKLHVLYYMYLARPMYIRVGHL